MLSGNHPVYGIIVRNYISGETPLATEHLVEQPIVRMVRNAVDFVIRSHYRADIGLFHGHFKRIEMVFAKYPFRKIGRRQIRSAFGLSVTREMFGTGKQVVFINELGMS